MSEIIVAGAGHGGVVAAQKLAEQGHRVTVFEKKKREELGYDQYDSVDNRFFKYAGIQVPEHWHSEPNAITLVPDTQDPTPITLPPEKNADALTIDRRELIGFLVASAQEAGVTFVFDCEIKSAVMLGSRVAGIDTSVGRFYADLVIDACGINSPVRRSLPAFTCVDCEIKKYDIIYTYRAYFDRKTEAAPPDTRYNIYLKNDGNVGFCWLICEKDMCDVLIVRFSPIENSDVLATLHMLYSENPYMSKDLLRPVGVAEIPVRQPLPVFVADGYAAIGDSACMTSPVKGSGIGLSLTAAQMLADTVEADKNGFYTGETLWPYEFRYFKEAGNNCCRLALAKSILPHLTAQDLASFLNSGIITTEELASLISNGAGTLLNKKGISALREKYKSLGEHAEIKKKLTEFLAGVVRYTVLEPLLPNKYDRADIPKWRDRYEEFFDSFRLKD